MTESNDSYFTFRITRRRFAELMANLVEKVTGQTVAPAPEGTFTAAGLLQGTSATTLSPKDTTTVEQGILLALRAWQAFTE